MAGGRAPPVEVLEVDARLKDQLCVGRGFCT